MIAPMRWMIRNWPIALLFAVAALAAAIDTAQIVRHQVDLTQHWPYFYAMVFVLFGLIAIRTVRADKSPQTVSRKV